MLLLNDISHYLDYTDYMCTPNTALIWVATGPTCRVLTLNEFDIQHIQT